MTMVFRPPPTPGRAATSCGTASARWHWSARSGRRRCKGPKCRRLRRAARAGRARRSRRSSATFRSCRSSRRSPPATARRLRRRHPGGPGGDPARLPDADLRLRRCLPRPDDPRAQGPRRRSCARRTACPSTPTSICTAAPSRPPTTAIRWTSSSRAQASTTCTRTTRTRRSSGTTTTPTAARRARSTTASSPPTCWATSARRSSSSRRASTTCRSSSPTTRSTGTARSVTRRTSTSASAATRSWSTAPSRRGWRVQRRIYRLRFLNASNARSYDLRLGNGRQMLQIASDGGLLERPVARTELPAAPRRADRGPGRLPALPAGLGDRAPEHRGEATTETVMRFDVVGGGGSEEARMPRGRMRTLREAARAERAPPLGPLAGDAVGRPVADRQPRLRPGAHRRPRGWARRSCGSGTTRPTACIRCTCTGCCSGSSSAARGHPPGRARLEGHDRRAAGRDRHGPAVVRALRRPLRLPLPRARARRQGDDAAAGGGQR